MDRGTHPVDRTAYAIPIGDRGHTHHSSTQPSIKSIGVTPGYCASSARRGTRRSGAEGLRGAPHARAAAPAGVGRTLWGCCVHRTRLKKKISRVCARARGGRPVFEDRSMGDRWETARRPPAAPEPAAVRRGVVRRAGPGAMAGAGRTWYIPINACGAKSVPSARARGDRTGRRSHPRGRPCRPLAPGTRSTAYA